jgi:hypothetical protein
VRSRAKAERRLVAVLAVAAAVSFGSPARVRAEVVYDLAPSAGVGITDNANLTSTPLSDEFSILGASARARYLGAAATHSLGYRLAWTHYYEGHGIDNLSNEITLLSVFNVSRKLELHLNADAILSRVSRIPLGNPATALPPQGAAGGNDLFLAVTGGEELVYHPDGRWEYLESLNATRVHYLQSPSPPDTLTLNARGRVDRLVGLNSYSLEMTSLGTLAGSNSLIMQLLAGWRREISLRWTGEVQLGLTGIFLPHVSPSVGPAGNASLGYRRIAWFANLSVARVPTPNLFLGAPTINNQAVLRLVLPLNQTETAAIAGTAGYVYANPVNDQFTKAFDQRSAGVVLSSKFGRLPVFGSLEYTVLSQHNNPNVPIAPNLFRQVLMLNINGLFTFGPGTPPILGAPM